MAFGSAAAEADIPQGRVGKIGAQQLAVQKFRAVNHGAAQQEVGKVAVFKDCILHIRGFQFAARKRHILEMHPPESDPFRPDILKPAVTERQARKDIVIFYFQDALVGVRYAPQVGFRYVIFMFPVQNVRLFSG